MATYYLDVDDEITSAAARIRSTPDVDVALVLPAGSRIATSRINFRLLAREASGRSRRLAIVAPEASSRALAASAGLPAFASVMEYEDARGRDAAAGEGLTPAPATTSGAEADRGVAGAAGAAVAGAAVIGATGATAAGPGGSAGAGGAAAGSPAADATAPGDGTRATTPDMARPRGAIGPSTGLAGGPATPVARRRRWPLAVAALLAVALLAGAGGAVAYVLLPTATVTLQLAAVPVGPVVFTGTADPDAVAVQADTATIPAVRVPVALSATGTFKATGKRVQSSFATGQVRWTNCDPTRAYTIPQGTLARTPSGIAFRTQEPVFLPVAILNPPRISCQNRTIAAQAVRDGTAGNVPAGSITVVPGEYNSVVIKVTNPAATAGGSREEFPQVTEKDVASATARLTKQLDQQLAAVAGDPPGTPAGTIAYPTTARRGEPVPSVPLADLVGQEVQTFDLTLTADGTVVAADPTPLEAIAAARVAAQVPAGMELREGSMRVTVGQGIAEGQLIRYPVEGRAEAVRGVSEREVRSMVKGKTPAEAQEVLAPYGTAAVTLWPDWASTITTIDPRLTVTVQGVPPAQASPNPTPAPAPRRRPPHSCRRPPPSPRTPRRRRPPRRDAAPRDRPGHAPRRAGHCRRRRRPRSAARDGVASAERGGRCRGPRPHRRGEWHRRARRGDAPRHVRRGRRKGDRGARMGACGCATDGAARASARRTTLEPRGGVPCRQAGSRPSRGAARARPASRSSGADRSRGGCGHPGG